MAALAMRYFLRLIGQAQAIAHPGPGLQQLLLDSGVIFMLTAALVLLHNLWWCNVELVFIAFTLWLLGAAFGMLSMVALQFPRLAVAAAAVARGLRNYLLGGL